MRVEGHEFQPRQILFSFPESGFVVEIMYHAIPLEKKNRLVAECAYIRWSTLHGEILTSA